MKNRCVWYWWLALVFLAGCYTVPETGRKSLSLAPDSIVLPQAASAFAQAKEKAKVSANASYNHRVQEITRRIVNAAGAGANLLPAEKWEVVVFEDDKMINAFAMPGGRVGVYTGLIRLSASDDELAVVLAHEIGHLSAKHGNERMSQGILAALGAVGSQIYVKDKEEDERNKILALYGGAVQFGYLLPYSRHHESEADAIGLLYMARAGYDPRAAVDFWKKMALQSKASPPEFLSTHPDALTRVEKIKQQLPKAMLEYERSKNG